MITASRPQVFRATILSLLIAVLAVVNPFPPIFAAEKKLTAEHVAALVPQLFKLHLSQHQLDAAMTKRQLVELVTQLDAGNNFYTKPEADAVSNLGEKELSAIAQKALAGDFSHYRQVIKDFLDKQIARDDAFFAGLDKRIDEIKAIAKEEEKSEKEEDDIKWTERAASNEEREKRILRMAAELYTVNKSYLSEEEAMKMAFQTVREEREKWKKISIDDETPKLFLKSFMLALDPHTEYMDAEDDEDFTERLERSFAGIGIQIRPCPLGAQIEDIIKGGPSEKSGKFARGDQIVAVDNVTLAGLPINKIVKHIKGEKGTEVKLTVLKRETKQTEVVALKRDTIQLSDMRVKGKKIDGPNGPVGVIYVQAFYVGVHKDVRDRINELSKDKPLAGVVLDLRFNAGGYLDEAVNLAGLFIETGPVVGERDGANRLHWVDDSDPDVTFSGPLVVLVNQFSASASEIVAGSLKDYGRAVVVGPTQTFGKGTVQRVIPLDALNLPGEIKMTTHQYFVAGGDSVQLKGVEPDVLIPGPKLMEDHGMLERSTNNPIPFNKVKPRMSKSRSDVKSWTEWKEKNVALLQENSKQRVEKNPELKALADSKKKRPEKKLDVRLKTPDAPPQEGDKKDEKDLQAEEAAAIVQDMFANWPKPAKQALAK